MQRVAYRRPSQRPVVGDRSRARLSARTKAFMEKRSRLLASSRDCLPSKAIVPVEAVLAAQLKPDGSRSRLLGRRSRASTDAAVHGHVGPADGRHSPRSAGAAAPGEAVASSPRARALPQLVRSESRDRRRPGCCPACGSGRLAAVSRRAAPLAQEQQRRRQWCNSIKGAVDSQARIWFRCDHGSRLGETADVVESAGSHTRKRDCCAAFGLPFGRRSLEPR